MEETFKSFSGSKEVQHNHHVKPTLQEYTYDAAIIHFDINDIRCCKNYKELKELANDIMKIAHLCQKYFGKMFTISITTCTRAFANIAEINVYMLYVYKLMYIKYVYFKQTLNL